MKKLAILSVLLILLFACAPATSVKEKVSEQRGKIGVILPLTGTFSSYGEDERSAIELALDKLGDKSFVVYEDSAGVSATGVTAFQKLKEVDNVKVIITATSWVTSSIYPQANDVLQVAIASAVMKRTRNDTTIRFTADVSGEADFLAKYLEQFDRIALLHLNTDYGTGWASILKGILGSRIVAAESYKTDEIDVSAQLAKIKASNPSAIVILGVAKEGSLFSQKIRDLGMNAQIVGTRPIEGPALLAKPEFVEGLVYSYATQDLNGSFAVDYEKKYGKVPSVFAAEAFDAVITLYSAMKDCDQDVSCLYSWYANKTYDGALGHVTFDDKGDAHYPFVLKQIKDGKFALK